MCIFSGSNFSRITWCYQRGKHHEHEVFLKDNICTRNFSLGIICLLEVKISDICKRAWYNMLKTSATPCYVEKNICKSCIPLLALCNYEGYVKVKRRETLVTHGKHHKYHAKFIKHLQIYYFRGFANLTAPLECRKAW